MTRLKRALALLITIIIISGCSTNITQSVSSSEQNTVKEDIVYEPVVLVPQTGEIKREKREVAWIDYSNCNEGYVVVNYHGTNNKVKLQIRTPRDNTYTFTLNGGDEIFPLTEGNGKYTVTVYENIMGKQYAAVLSCEADVSLRNEFLPFLYPNQYVMFTPECKTVHVGAEAARNAESQLEVVSRIYNYVMDNLEYDYDKARTVQSGYTPDVDSILREGKGICFDYAAVMAAMLRSLEIPTKMDVGWAGDIYHAWISVYIEQMGWINGIIEFNGVEWKLMDPTFADNADQSKAIMRFIEDNNNYEIKYRY